MRTFSFLFFFKLIFRELPPPGGVNVGEFFGFFSGVFGQKMGVGKWGNGWELGEMGKLGQISIFAPDSQLGHTKWA